MYDALGAPTVFAIGNHAESPGCLVEQAVNGALGAAFAEAEAVFVKHLRSVKLSDLGTDLPRRVHAHASSRAPKPSRKPRTKERTNHA